MFSNIHFVKQHDITDCGVACLAMIFKYYGIHTSISKLREVTFTDKEGTSGYALVLAATKYGFTTKGLKECTVDTLKTIKLPLIANVLIDKKLFHYVVVYKITKNTIFIADPAKGLKKLTYAEFKEIWLKSVIVLDPTNIRKTKNNNPITLIKFLFTMILSFKKWIVFIFLLSLLFTLLGIAGSFYFKYLFDNVIGNHIVERLNIISLIFVFVFIIQSIINYSRNIILGKLALKIDKDIMLKYFLHVLKLPFSFFNNRKDGEILSRFLDASKIREAVSGFAVTIMIDTLMGIVGGFILFNLSKNLFYITMCIMLAYALVVFIFNSKIRHINTLQMEENATLSSYLIEVLKGIETIKSFSTENIVGNETEKKLDNVIDKALEGNKLYSLLTAFTSSIHGLGTIIILWYGTTQVLKGTLSSGELLSFNALLLYFLSPIKNLIDLSSGLQSAFAAFARLVEILELEIEKLTDNKIIPDNLFNKIEFKNVSFKYGYKKQILSDVNIIINPGERVAIVGESGAGKTTIARLLLNFIKPENGNIYIGEFNINELPLEFIRKKTAYISQNIFLFSGTIRENISHGKPEASIEDVIEASKAASCHDFIENLAQKYDTYIEENGANLSEGQRQRIAFARALILNPDILILDEATSHLDNITETYIENTLNSLDGKVTRIIIAHRFNTIMKSDKIFVLENGTICESGTHDQLLESKGLYFRLHS